MHPKNGLLPKILYVFGMFDPGNTLTLGLGEGRTLSAVLEGFVETEIGTGVLVVMASSCTVVWGLEDVLVSGTGPWLRDFG